MGLIIGNLGDNLLPTDVKDALDISVPMYGVKFDGVNAQGIRTYDAAGMSWQPSTNTVAGVDDFKDVAPFKVRECCRVWDSTQSKATYYYKDNYTDTEWQTVRNGTHATIKGDILIEIPKFYYKRPSKYEFIVAPKYKNGFKLAPCFHHQSGDKDCVRVTKYNIGSGYVSRSGVSTLSNTTMDTFRTGLRNKGMNMMDYATYYSLMILMLVKYANMDSQATVGYGYTEGNHTYNAGNADNVLGLDGSASGLGVNNAVLAMGIENFWGNVSKFLDGMYGYNGNIYIKDVETVSKNPTTVAELSEYTKVATTYPTNMSQSSIGDVAFDTDNDYLMFATATGSLPCNDNAWSASTLDCVIVGGSAWNGSDSGLFAFSVGVPAGSSSMDYNALGLDF